MIIPVGCVSFLNGAGGGVSANDKLDAIYRPTKSGLLPTIPLAQFYTESAAAGYVLSSSNVNLVQIYADSSAAQNDYFYYRLGAIPFLLANSAWSWTWEWELFTTITPPNKNKPGSRFQFAICNIPPFGTIDEATRRGVAVEFWSNGGTCYCRLIRKLTTGSAVEVSSAIPLLTSGSVPISDPIVNLWLKNKANGELELRLDYAVSYTTFPVRPVTANANLAAGTHTAGVCHMYFTGLATSATATENSAYTSISNLQYHITG